MILNRISKLALKLLLTVISVGFFSTILAQDKNFLLEDLKWLSGHWKGEAFGGTVEEIWSGPSDNAMMGMFRLQYDAADKLYEFLLIEKSDTGVSMSFKHIKSGYKEMEDKPLILKLVKLTHNFAEFVAGDQSLLISYRLSNEDSLEIILSSTKASKKKITPITMKRQNK